MAKNIALFFDGTWNTPDDTAHAEDGDSTNVYQLYQAVLKHQGNTSQVKWYDDGVGTQWYDRLSGGIGGAGLSKNIRDGYKYLVDHYEEGDRVFLFGFSRGAYTARSLVGMIRNAGLLLPAHKGLLDEAYVLYRSRDKSADTENARLFRSHYAREIEIHFLGVWDTVGALGVPMKSFGWFNKAFYEFHDTELSGIVKHAYQALALDEWRENYTCTMWDPKHKPDQVMEQVWFSGAHANIGGGYKADHLSDISLAWMMEKAAACGLGIDSEKQKTLSKELAPIKDSYKEFLGGAYSKIRDPYYRNVGMTPFGQEALDPSVTHRLESNPGYRPKNKIGEYLTGVEQGKRRLY